MFSLSPYFSHSKASKGKQNLDFHRNLSSSKVHWFLIHYSVFSKNHSIWLETVVTRIKQVAIPLYFYFFRVFFFFWVSEVTCRIHWIQGHLKRDSWSLKSCRWPHHFLLIYYCFIWHFMSLIPVLRLRNQTDYVWLPTRQHSRQILWFIQTKRILMHCIV